MTDRLQQIEELLTLFWNDTESLLWSPAGQPGPMMTYGPEHDTGPIQFSVQCSDTFSWATAESEHIELPNDLATLRAAHDEFPDDDWPMLWVCRKRGMRPMTRLYARADPDAPFTRALLAAGPERERGLGNP